MSFEPGDIVVIVYHVLPYVIGRSAEVQGVYPRGAEVHPLLAQLGLTETWYVLLDVAGEKRAAAHSWLRRADPVPFRIAETADCA